MLIRFVSFLIFLSFFTFSPFLFAQEDESKVPWVYKELVFFDSSIPDVERLLQAKREEFEVVWIEGNRSGLDQITQVLERFAAQNIRAKSLHIVSHGSPDQLDLGSIYVGLDELQDNQEKVEGWQKALSPDAQIFIYGCSFAATEKGKQFVQLLKALTQTEVAASTDLTGAQVLGGNWRFEYRTGPMTFSSPFYEKILLAYPYIL